MKKPYFVYQITNRINGKIYIGKSNHRLKNGSTRWKIHLRIAKGGKKKYGRSFSIVHAAIRKYGKENFTYEIIRHTRTEKAALKLEQYYIAKLKKSGQQVYNVTSGGEGMTGHKHSQKSRQAISFAQQGEKSVNAKLTENDVYAINNLLDAGALRSAIAQQFSTSVSTINMIARGKRWAHLYQPSKVKDRKPNIPKGDMAGNSILTSEKVLEIKLLLKDGKTQSGIAKLFGVSKTTIQNIASGRTWSHITAPR
jgi:group I intron endonuclease